MDAEKFSTQTTSQNLTNQTPNLKNSHSLLGRELFSTLLQIVKFLTFKAYAMNNMLTKKEFTDMLLVLNPLYLMDQVLKDKTFDLNDTIL